jgi:hypothetical protein
MDAGIDEVMKAYATDAVAPAARRGVLLDYSERSLADVDALLARESFVGRTPRTPAAPEDDETMWNCAKMFGAYVGEVALRVLGGRWIAQTTESGGTRAAIEVDGLTGFPIDKVWKRLSESELDTVSGYCRAMRAIIASRARPKNERP